MMGIDIQEAKRFKTIVGTDKMAKIFSSYEIGYLESKNLSLESFAGIYAAKEAIGKATGVGIQKNRLPLIEVRHRDNGAPYYYLHESIADDFLGKWHLSISHTKSVAVAVCISI